MEVLLTLLSLAVLVFLAASFIGLISPKLVKQTSRGKAFGIFFALAIAATVLVGVLAPDAAPLPQFSIVSDEQKRNIKRSVVVEIQERISTEDLERVSQSIYQKGYEKFFILFRLEGEDKRQSAWASVSFKPELEVKILGSTKEEHEKAKEIVPSVAGDILGVWLVNWGSEYKSVIYKQGNDYYKQDLFTTGDGKAELLTIAEIEHEVRYATEGGKENGEYFTVASSGALQFWSENGNYYSAPVAR